MMERNKDILIIISLFLVAFLIRAVGVSNVCIYGDEWLYWTDTNKILISDFVPREDVFKYTNTFLQHIGAVVTVLFGADLNTLRMISVIFGSLTVPMLYLFGKAMYDRKTGLLAALFMCFSAFHCLHSRIYMFEALTLFFITAFLYFFWLSESIQKVKYACFAGAMMGLAIDAKYLSIFLIPAIIGYVLWTRKFNFKALMGKRIFLIFVFAIVFFLPLLISLYLAGVGLYPLYYHAVVRFEKTTDAGDPIRELPLDKLIVDGSEKISDLLTRGAKMLPWPTLFQLSAMLLFIITLSSYLPAFLNVEKKGCFLIIPFIIFYFCLFIGASRHYYYIIYSLPFYFVMLSHVAVSTFAHLKENNFKNIYRIFIISLVVITLFSSFSTGATSPYWDEGEYSWAKSGADFINSDVTKNGYERYIVIAVTTIPEVIDHPSHFRNNINVTYLWIFKETSKYSGKLLTVDLKKFDLAKPSYLIISETDYKYYFSESIKRNVFEDYELVFHSHDYPTYGCLVLKRKNMQPPELLFPADDKDGKISHGIFRKSVPNVMKIGKTYTALVRVKNTGDSRTDFSVRVCSDPYTLFVEGGKRDITLDKDSSRILKFKINPIKEHVGEVPIMVTLHIKHDDETYRKVDSSTNYVYLIEI